MLTVETYVAPSTLPGAGLGLFAAVSLPKGSVVTREQPDLDVALPVERISQLDPVAREMIATHAYKDHREGRDVWVLCADNARFANHHASPNVINHPVDPTATVTARDIVAGEEMFVDYRTFDLDWRAKVGHVVAAA